MGSCSDGVAGPDVSPIVFRGTVVAGGLIRHDLDLKGYGGVRIELEEVTLRLVDGTGGDSGEDVSLGFGLGNPEDDQCVTTFRSAMIEGGFLSLGLGNNVYCLLMFDTGLLSDDASVDYVVVATL